MGYNLNGGIKKLIKMIFSLIGLMIIVLTFYKVSIYIAPFIIAFIISYIIEPLNKLLVSKLKIPRKVSSAIALLAFISTLGASAVFIIIRTLQELISISHLLPQYLSITRKNIDTMVEKGTSIYFDLPKEITLHFQDFIESSTYSLFGIANSILTSILSKAATIPQTLIFILVTLIASYFFASDRDEIYGFFKKYLPKKWLQTIHSVKRNFFSALIGYVRVQFILMGITFIELGLGFIIIGIKQPLATAFLISCIDVLPILGAGCILLPWSIYEFLIGDIRLGISLVILYGIVVIIRQMLEPKILGYQIGLHPLLTLLAMYTGLQLFGLLGLIFGPIFLVLVKSILSGFMNEKPQKNIITKTK